MAHTLQNNLINDNVSSPGIAPSSTPSAIWDRMINMWDTNLKKNAHKLVGKAISFDEIKMIDDEIKEIVIGYIKIISKLCADQYDMDKVPSFYLVPQLVIHWCYLYLHDSFPKIIRDIYNPSKQVQYGAARRIRDILSTTGTPPIKQIIDIDIVPRFIQLCENHEYPQLQYESLWVLLNIASGQQKYAAYIITANGHKSVINLLGTSQLYEIKAQAMWALRNISGDANNLKDFSLNNGILTNILDVAKSTFDEKYVTNFDDCHQITNAPLIPFLNLLHETSNLLMSLSRDSPPATQQHLESIVQSMNFIMKQHIEYRQYIEGDVGDHSDKERIEEELDGIITFIAWGASYLTHHDYESVGYNGERYVLNTMCNCGLIKQFVEFMDNKNAAVRFSCVRVIGHIVTGSDDDTHYCLQLGILEKYYNVLTKYLKYQNNVLTKHLKYLKHENNNFKKPSDHGEIKQILWSLSNIAAGPIEDKLSIEKHGLFKILCDCLRISAFDIGYQALWGITNGTDKECDVIEKFVEQYGLISALCSFLQKVPKDRERTFLVAFACIENILKFGAKNQSKDEANKYEQVFEDAGMIRFLEDIQSNECVREEVCAEAEDIIIKYFNGYVDED